MQGLWECVLWEEGIPHSGPQFPGSDLFLSIHVVGGAPGRGGPHTHHQQPLAVIQRFVVERCTHVLFHFSHSRPERCDDLIV